MRSEDLVLRAAPKSVDLVTAAQLSMPDQPKRVRPRRRLAGRVIDIHEIEARSQIKGRPTISFNRPMWTAAELAQAGAGVPEHYFNAACYAFAGEQSLWWHLVKPLSEEAQRLRKWCNWPLFIKDRHGFVIPYLDQLAGLVLDEDRFPQLFKDRPQERNEYCHTTPKVWATELSERYEEIRYVWIRWLDSAARIMQPRLASAEEGEGDVQ